MEGFRAGRDVITRERWPSAHDVGGWAVSPWSPCLPDTGGTPRELGAGNGFISGCLKTLHGPRSHPTRSWRAHFLLKKLVW